MKIALKHPMPDFISAAWNQPRANIIGSILYEADAQMLKRTKLNGEVVDNEIPNLVRTVIEKFKFNKDFYLDQFGENIAEFFDELYCITRTSGRLMKYTDACRGNFGDETVRYLTFVINILDGKLGFPTFSTATIEAYEEYGCMEPDTQALDNLGIPGGVSTDSIYAFVNMLNLHRLLALKDSGLFHLGAGIIRDGQVTDDILHRLVMVAWEYPISNNGKIIPKDEWTKFYDPKQLIVTVS